MTHSVWKLETPGKYPDQINKKIVISKFKVKMLAQTQQ